MKASAQQTVITRGHKVVEGILVGLKGPTCGREYVLVGRRVLLGRGDNCDILLRDLNASRKHALLWSENGGFVIKDNHSKNGTYINGKRIAKRELKDGDLLGIGESVFRFRADRSQISRSVSTSRSSLKKESQRGSIGSLPQLNRRPQSSPKNHFHMPVASQKEWKLPIIASLVSLIKRNAKPRRIKNMRALPRRAFIFTALFIILVLMVLPILTPKKRPARQKELIKPTAEPTSQVIKKPLTTTLRTVAAQPSISTPLAKTANKSVIAPSRRVVNVSLARERYSKAIQAMSANDYKRAILLFEEVVAIHPKHPGAGDKISLARKRLQEQIEHHYNMGMRDYANLYYERALREWQKVAALSSQFDDTYNKKALAKISEAKQRMIDTR